MAGQDPQDHLASKAQGVMMSPWRWCCYQEMKALLDVRELKEMRDPQESLGDLDLKVMEGCVESPVWTGPWVYLDCRGRKEIKDYLDHKVYRV